MSKTWRKLLKVVLIWTVVVLLTFDTAMACRFFARCHARRGCVATSICYEVCDMPIGCPVECYPPAEQLHHPSPPTPLIESEQGHGLIRPELPVPQKIEDAQPELKPMQPPPAEPAKPAVPAPAPAAPAPAALEPAEPAPAEPAPAEPAPAEPAPAEPAPAEPAPAKPAEAPDDLFGEAKPADAPAAPAPAAPAPEAPPAEAMPEVPEKPAEPADDLFGDPKPAVAPANPAAPPADDSFGGAEPAPADAPAAAPAAAPAPAAAEPAPADAPAAGAAVDAAADDLFGETPKSAEPPAPAVEQPAPAAPAPAAPEAPPAGPAKDDPFGRLEKKAHDLLVVRHWTDNTGSFSVEGKLIAILDGKVRLLKENGRTCTVPVRRLSRADAAYVQTVAAQLGEGNLLQLAIR